MSAAPAVHGGDSAPRARERVLAVAVALAAGALVGAVALTHAASPLPFDPRPLLAFDAAKVPAFLRSAAVLAALNLAAWAAGGLACRLLGAGGSGGLDRLRRLALGLLALADLVLLLAALRLLRPALLIALVLTLAAAGAVDAVRSRRWSVRPPAADMTTSAMRAGVDPSRRTGGLPGCLLCAPEWIRRAALGAHRDFVASPPDPQGALAVTPLRGFAPQTPQALAAAAVLLMAVGALLGAHMPDYGWDAFTYHLALPERYLFENRIVVSPLFPHSALPLTVEMLYALVLAMDPGPAAKLLHAELGALAAAAAALIARRHSRRAAALAVIVLAADPLFNWELGVAYSDLGAALFAVLALASLQERLAGGGGASLRLTGVLAGACVATRYTAAAVPLAVVLILALAPLPWRRKLGDAAAVAGLSALVLSPWLVRNLALTGNPAAPALQRLFYEPGQEYFDAQAVEQQIAFARGVGFGRGVDDLLALPVNLTLRARADDYTAFGFRIGPLYVAGLAAALALTRARRSAAVSGLLPAAGVLTLAWFSTAQEPRYLMPALGVAAAAAGVGCDELLRACARLGPRWPGAAAWLVPLAALGHAQAATLARLPYVYGYALGRLPVRGFRSQEPAWMVADRLRGLLGPGDRLLLVYEPRGFFFRGMDYVFAHYFELMQLVHRAGDPDTLAAELREMGVTHVLVNAGNVARYRTVPVPGYGPRELDAGLRLLEEMLRRRSTALLEDRGVVVRRMEWAGPGPGKESPWE